MIKVKIFAALALLLVMCTTSFGRDNSVEPQRELYFRCKGEEYTDKLDPESPAKILLQINSKTVKVTGAFMFTNADIPIINETDSEIKFDYRLASMVRGEFGVFSKATGHLRLDINQGEDQKVTHHLWGEYECKPIHGFSGGN